MLKLRDWIYQIGTLIIRLNTWAQQEHKIQKGKEKEEHQIICLIQILRCLAVQDCFLYPYICLPYGADFYQYNGYSFTKIPLENLININFWFKLNQIIYLSILPHSIKLPFQMGVISYGVVLSYRIMLLFLLLKVIYGNDI